MAMKMDRYQTEQYLQTAMPTVFCATVCVTTAIIARAWPPALDEIAPTLLHHLPVTIKIINVFSG